MYEVGQKSRGRVEQMRREQEAAARRRRTWTVTAVVVAVLALVVGGGIALQVSRSGGDGGGSAEPAGTVERYAIPRGDASAPVTLTIYEDFLCPACRTVESYLKQTIDRYVEDGRVRVEYRPIAFLDQASTTDYSTRALSAAACVLDRSGRDAFVRMHDLLYANQPPEGGPGLSDEQLASLAERAGADRAVVADCIERRPFAGWIEDATDQASQNGVNATPTLLVNGEQVQFSNDEDPVETLSRAVENAA
jgi:protein-disulfide isomerase